MPYINKEQRKSVDGKLEILLHRIKYHPENKRDGILNYIFTKLLTKSFDKENYLNYERMIGCLECCKLELYRRQTALYEKKKIKENGDVYEK